MKNQTSPRTLWPNGTLNLREPRLAQPGKLVRKPASPKVGVIKPIRSAIKPTRIAVGQPRASVLHVLVPLSSLVRPRRYGL